MSATFVETAEETRTAPADTPEGGRRRALEGELHRLEAERSALVALFLHSAAERARALAADGGATSAARIDELRGRLLVRGAELEQRLDRLRARIAG